MYMALLKHIESKTSFEKVLEKELLKFVCYFQDNLWDGYSDEDDPKFITPEDFEAIEALSDKIKHMTLYIGCPNSVEPMLQSIAERKVKRWQGNDALTTENHVVYEEGRPKVVKGFKKGKQLRTKQQKARVSKSIGYYGDTGKIIVGHFRWNNQGYILSRRCTDLLTNLIFGTW